MEKTSRICPYCGEPIQKGFIEIFRTGWGYLGIGAAWINWKAGPEQGRLGTKWKTDEPILRSSRTYRKALKCNKCNIIIFDPRDPDKPYPSTSDTGPWKY